MTQDSECLLLHLLLNSTRVGQDVVIDQSLELTVVHLQNLVCAVFEVSRKSSPRLCEGGSNLCIATLVLTLFSVLDIGDVSLLIALVVARSLFRATLFVGLCPLLFDLARDERMRLLCCVFNDIFENSL